MHTGVRVDETGELKKKLVNKDNKDAIDKTQNGVLSLRLCPKSLDPRVPRNFGSEHLCLDLSFKRSKINTSGL